MSDWLKNLAVGDEVIVTSSDIGGGDRLARVERVTATLFIVHGRVADTGVKFRRSDGQQPGDADYHRSFLVEPTQDKRDSITTERHVAFFKNFDWSTLPLNTLREIYKATQV